MKNITIPMETFAKIASSYQGLLQEVSATRSYDLSDSLLNGYNPNQFMSRKGFKVIDEMLTDDHIFGVLEMKKAFLLGTGYDFHLEEEADDKNFCEILDFIKTNFTKMYTKNLTKDLYQILTAHEYGFSASEKLFKKDSFKTWTDKIWLTRLKTIPPHSTEFKTDQVGHLDVIFQRQTNGIQELPIWKMLVYTKNERFDNPYGKSELQRCYRPWFIKDKVIKFWGIYLQRFASPFPVGKLPPSSGDENVNALLKILESMQQAGAAVIPDNATVDFLQSAKSSGSEYDQAIERLNQMIARAVLIPDLLGFGQTTKGGSYNLGSKQFQIFLSILDYERLILEDLINDECIKPLVDMNFGPQEVYPTFRFNPYEDETLLEMLKLFITSVEKGLPVTLEDVNHFRKKINFPELAEDYEALELNKSATPPAAAGNPEADNGMIDQNSPEKPAEEDSGSEKPAKDGVDSQDVEEETTDEKYSMLSREPNKYESRVDFMREADILQGQGDELVASLAKIFAKMKNNLKDTIIRKGVIDNSKLDEVQKIQLKYLGDVKDTMKTALQDVYDNSVSRAKKEISGLRDSQKQSFAKLTDLRVPLTEAVKLAYSLIDQRTFQAVGKVKDDILNKAKAALISGIEKGQSTQDIMRKLDEVFNGVTIGSATAELTYAPSLLETIVRTNVTNLDNLARKQVAQGPNMNGYIAMYMYSAILDDRTTDICNELDGHMAPIDDPIWNAITPPNHFNCRSVLRYITQVDVEMDGLSPSEPVSVDELADMPGTKDFIK